jgi:pimeloyl-ACP methyl ester carboxylesterase
VNTVVRPLARPTIPSSVRRRNLPVGALLLRSLVLLILVLAALPVALLPISTMVPTLVWVLLAVLEAALVVALFWLKWTWLAVGGAFAGSIILALITVVASQAFAGTPPIRDAQGKPIPNSIAVLEKVTLNGSEQWITIRGQNVNNPVLLNLGMGGPGGGGFATRSLFEALEANFVVVSWDEPGTGKSYRAVPISSLTPQRFVDDAYALTELLRGRFHQDKIYVYGTSWTSILGVWLVQQHPDLFHAYVGNGQMVNTTENDVLGYELALKFSAERGDKRALDTLRRNGPPPYTGDGVVFKYLAFLDILNDYMHSPRYALVVPIVPLFAPEYGLVDKVNHTRGLIESFNVVYPQLRDLDFITQAPKLEVPVYIFTGRDDVNAMASLVERYYNVLEAPRKQLIWLEGGHGLNDSNLGQFTEVMVNTVLAETFR